MWETDYIVNYFSPWQVIISCLIAIVTCFIYISFQIRKKGIEQRNQEICDKNCGNESCQCQESNDVGA